MQSRRVRAPSVLQCPCPVQLTKAWRAMVGGEGERSQYTKVGVGGALSSWRKELPATCSVLIYTISI